jgi:hypothetical protein
MPQWRKSMQRLCARNPEPNPTAFSHHADRRPVNGLAAVFQAEIRALEAK